MAARVTGSAAVRPEVAVALAKVLDPSPMGRRPARVDKKVRGVCNQLGWSPPLRPSHIVAALGLSLEAASPRKPCLTLPKSGTVAPTVGRAAHHCTTFIGCGLRDRYLAKRLL